MIIDYSTARPTMATLHAAGVTAVGRYIGWDSVAGYPTIHKNLTKPEADELISNGIDIFLAFEYAANAAAKGSSQGTPDASLATIQLQELGAPADMAVYFAVDFDLPDYAPSLPNTPASALAKLGPVGHYFQAIHAAKPRYEVGAYGGFYAIKRLFDAGLISKGWQTVAWSGGQLDSRAVLYQTTALLPPPLAGLGADDDIREHAATVWDFGQWPRPAVPVSTTTKETDMGYPMILDSLHEVAICLPVPAGKTRIHLSADALGMTPPKIRVGFGPKWSKVELEPTWETDAVEVLPAGTTKITVSRLDGGIVPVTVDFS